MSEQFPGFPGIRGSGRKTCPNGGVKRLAMFKIIEGKQDSLIVSHEAEDRVEKISEPEV